VRWTRIVLLPVLLCGLAACDSTDAETPKQRPDSSVSLDANPPVISEQFTPLPCPAKPKTTRDFEGCAEQRIVRSDNAINEQVRLIFSLRMSAKARARFVRSERAWLTYRRALCESRADVYEGGSAARVVYAECVANENAAHLKDLSAFERDLRRGRR
jgi:uncharacterized protein YecT (DUF1311 family)